MASVVSSLTGGVSGNSGAAGINYQASQANLMQPVTQDQINAGIANANTQQQQQQQLLQALQGQQGIQNQSSVFNQLQGVANGTGPNPAQAMLAQSTGQNVANQASLMAGQRGSSQNVGLIARQAAQQGAQTQQQAAGQAATMQAQQSLGALQGLGSLATQQVNQQMGQQAQNANYAQSQEGQLLGSAASLNSALTGSQQSVNSSNSMIANNVASQQGKLFSNITSGASGAVTGLLAEGGEVRKPMADGGDPGMSVPTMYTPPPAPTTTTTPGPASRLAKYMHANFGTSEQQAAQGGPTQEQQSFETGAKIGSAVKGWFSSTPSTASSGYSGSDLSGDAAAMHQMGTAQDSPNFNATNGLTGDAASMHDAGMAQQASDDIEDASEASGGGGMAAAMMAKGGKVPVLLSPGERYLPPKAVKKVEKGANPMKEGKKVPGTPKVKGAKNSYANDTVKATLDEGGIVLPRSVTQHKNPDWAAHAFVRGIMAKNRTGLKR